MGGDSTINQRSEFFSKCICKKNYNILPLYLHVFLYFYVSYANYVYKSSNEQYQDLAEESLKI